MYLRATSTITEYGIPSTNSSPIAQHSSTGLPVSCAFRYAYKYGNKDGKYFISFDFANAENTEIGVQFSKNGNKISVNFDKMKELFDSMNEKESVDNSGMDMSAMFQYTAIFNFDKKVASVTGVDAEITGKKTVKVPIKINSFPKGDVVITLK